MSATVQPIRHDMRHVLLVLAVASSNVSARPGVSSEAIALADIELREGSPATVALVDDKNCRLHGKVVFQKPVDAPRLVMRGGWEIGFSSKTCTRADGAVVHSPVVGIAVLPFALKGGARIEVLGLE